MTWSDPIVDEVRRARDAYAARFNYDLRAIYRDLKDREKRGGRNIVSYAENETPPNQVVYPPAPAMPVSQGSNAHADKLSQLDPTPSP